MAKYVPFGAAHATLSQVILLSIGQLLIRALRATSDKSGALVKFFVATQQTTCRATSAAGATALHINASAAVVDGAVLTTNDYVICESNGGLFMDKIAGVTTTGGSESLTLTSNIPTGKGMAVGQRIWIVRAANISSVALGAATLLLEYMAASYPGMPIGIQVDSTSAGYFAGLAEDVG